MRPPRGPNSFNFMQFLGNFGKIVRWRPPGKLVSPPGGNPGSATALGKLDYETSIGTSYVTDHNVEHNIFIYHYFVESVCGINFIPNIQ